MNRRRLGVGYVTLALGGAAVAALSFHAGSGRHAAPAIAGSYHVVAGRLCLGKEVAFTQSGEFVSGAGGKLRLQHDRLTGTARCRDGSRPPPDLPVAHQPLAGSGLVFAPVVGQGRATTPPPTPSGEDTIRRVMLPPASAIPT